MDMLLSISRRVIIDMSCLCVGQTESFCGRTEMQNMHAVTLSCFSVRSSLNLFSFMLFVHL